MAESILTRVYRLANAGADSVLDAAERFSSDSLLRDAIRDMDSAIDTLARERRAATDRLTEIEQDRATQRERLDTLAEQARYALDRDRPDLAERAIAARLDVEHAIAAFDEQEAATTASRDRIDAALTDASDRRARMTPDSTAPVSNTLALDSRVADAEARFHRARALVETQRSDTLGLGEIEALRRQERIATDLAALRAESAKPKRIAR